MMTYRMFKQCFASTAGTSMVVKRKLHGLNNLIFQDKNDFNNQTLQTLCIYILVLCCVLNPNY